METSGKFYVPIILCPGREVLLPTEQVDGCAGQSGHYGQHKKLLTLSTTEHFVGCPVLTLATIWATLYRPTHNDYITIKTCFDKKNVINACNTNLWLWANNKRTEFKSQKFKCIMIYHQIKKL
jgi:uncharacterized Fe-S center protein